MSSPTYRYILDFDDADPVIVYPIVRADQVFSYKKEEEQVFLRKVLAGTPLEFSNDEYDLINDKSLTTKFTIRLAKLNEFGTYIVKYVGVFYKTDCDFDDDSKLVSVVPLAQDIYKDILEKMDREFDLLELAPPKVTVEYDLVPVFQFWGVIDGVVTDYISNWRGGVEFQEPVLIASGLDVNDLLNVYNFGWLGEVLVLSGDDFDPVVPSEYIHNATGSFSMISKDGTHTVTRNFGAGTYELKNVSSGAVLYQAPSGPGLNDNVFVSLVSGAELQSTEAHIYGRMLTGLDTVGVTPSVARPTEDISEISRVYDYTYRLGFSAIQQDVYSSIWKDFLVGSYDNQATPTKYGNLKQSTFFDGNYFSKPVSAFELLPVQRSEWTFGAFWFQVTNDVQDLITDGSKTMTLADGYKLVDVLIRMMEELDIGITVAEDDNFSQFFYSDPINSIRSIDAHPIITPKSNIIIGDYTLAASRAPIKLSDVLNLYWSFYKCKWHLEPPYFRLEHMEYYQNGMSYDAPVIGADLTLISEPKTNLSWGYKANKWSYDKSKLPAQLRFGWMDEVPKAFKGYDIDVISPQVDQANIKDHPLTLFTSDIGMMQIAPDEVSKNGFAFMECTFDGSIYTVPIVSLNLDGDIVSLLNGYASFLFAHDQYHPYVAPANDITINGTATTANSVKRTRIQELEIPSDIIDDDDIMKLVRSGLGDGQIRELTDRSDGSGSKIVIEHDLE